MTPNFIQKIQSRLIELQDFVHTQLTQAAHSQKYHYDQHNKQSIFVAGDSVWLSIPTAGKLGPKWEGEWVIKSMRSPKSVMVDVIELCTLIVYDIILLQANVKQLCLVTLCTQMIVQIGLDHVILPPVDQIMTTRYHQRDRRPPDRYRP